MKDYLFLNIYFFFYLLVIIVSLTIGYISLGINFNFDVYSSFQGDGTLLSTIIKSIQENGISGIWFNKRLGAPETSSFIDWPVQDLLMSLILWSITIFTDSIPRTQYIYLIITFLLDALSMAILLKKLKMSSVISFTISILFTVAPFHFFRFLGHAVLSNYMSFALTMYLSLNVLGIIKEEKKDRWKIWVCGVLLGIGYGYYYAFGLIVLATAYFMRFLKLEHKKDLLGQLWIGSLVLVTIFLSLLPKIVYSFIYGSNQIVGKRSYIEQEIYGLKIVQMLLPPSYSRFSVFRSLNQEYSSKAPLVTENAFSSLGLVASIGFLILCITMFVSISLGEKKKKDKWLLVDFLSLATLSLLLMGMIGGFGEIFNYFVTAQIRCYNRCSIYIAGLSLVMIAHLFMIVRSNRKWVLGIVCAAVLMVGFVDQVNYSDKNNQKALKNKQEQYEEFFSQVEGQLEKNAMVYQLPYLDFPEVSADFDYKHFIGYLFTDTLKWSYGGIKGRNLLAGSLNIDEGMSYLFLSSIKEAGFDAVYIDLSGYDDEKRTLLLQFYQGIGVSPIISKDELLYLYDISSLEIFDGMLKPGYAFVSSWMDKYGMDLGNEEKAYIAEGIRNLDKKAYLEMYAAIRDEDVISIFSDDTYIDFLYSSILGRKESSEERDSWVKTLEKGVSREDVFYDFLNSQEFRIRQGYDKLAKED